MLSKTMLISEDELQRRLASGNNLANSLRVVPLSERPVRPQVARLPEPVRVLAGSLANVDGAAKVAHELGLPVTQVRAAQNSKKESVKSAIENTRDRVSELALNQLLGVVGLLTPDAVASEKPKDQAAIAASLSKVVSNVSPRDTAQGSAVNIVIYAPEQRKESSYKVLDV